MFTFKQNSFLSAINNASVWTKFIGFPIACFTHGMSVCLYTNQTSKGHNSSFIRMSTSGFTSMLGLKNKMDSS